MITLGNHVSSNAFAVIFIPFLTFSVVILLFYSIWLQNSFCLNFDKYLNTAPLT